MSLHARRTMLLAALLVGASLLGGCADGGDAARDDAGTTTETTPATTPDEDDANAPVPADEQAMAKLRVRVENVGDKSQGAGVPIPEAIPCDRSLPATCRGTITCPAAYDDVDDQQLCAWLAREGAELLTQPPPQQQVCTQVYGGPEVATVTGNVDGEEVDARFTRTNGCEIARFDEASPLWTGEVPRDDAEHASGEGSDRPIEPEVITDPPEAFDY